jgi:hypothetical protein
MQVELLKAAGKDAPARSRPPAGDPNDPRGDGWNAAEMLADDEVRAMLSPVRQLVDEDGPHAIGEVASREALAADVVGTTAMRKGELRGDPAAAPPARCRCST